MLTIQIENFWHGEKATKAAEIKIVKKEALYIEIEAPFYDDPAPAAPPGFVDELWNFEVVELFLVGADDVYIEFEFGPHGHYLVYWLQGNRNIVRRDLRIEYQTTIDGSQWRGRAVVPLEHLPAGLSRYNAFAMHSAGLSRKHITAYTLPGEEPNFHQIQHFPPLPVGWDS